MNFNDLTTFVKIYETGSLNQSAIILGYAQSNLSVRLKTLESEMNTALFIRKNTGIVPTTAGDKFYQFAKLTLEQFEVIKKSLGTQERLVLISELLLHYDMHQTCRLDLTQDQIIIKKTFDILHESQKNFYHEIFCFNQINHLRGLTETQELIKVSYLCSDQLLDENDGHVFVNSDQSCPFRQKTLRDYSNTKKIIELDSFEAIISAVESGQGMALLPNYFLDIKKLQKCDQKDGTIKYYHYK